MLRKWSSRQQSSLTGGVVITAMPSAKWEGAEPPMPLDMHAGVCLTWAQSVIRGEGGRQTHRDKVWSVGNLVD